ncbi:MULTISPECIES: methyltransferase [Streptomyces]|uniref:Methyltransferase n=1 Tax=Streptomyces lonegramiae TaxID=3075524 RepID=A0ABU2XHE8_9ACTN|nr:methyltransferase [Streptomyces sp. DSM 41529]MDT0545262.1 methyltransferase [Streptomyces sp. DSM 41529]
MPVRTTTPGTKNRASALHKVRYAVRHPERVPRYVRRMARDLRLRVSTRDHIAYYRAVMRDDTARSPEAAVGSASHERWLALGQMQHDYLLRHGLRPEDRMLDIGCGNLRGGWRFVDYLDAGHYHGIDISPDILLAAQEVVAGRGLQAKLPHLGLVRDLRLAALPEAYFTVVHAHSVFSHSPREVIAECLAHVGRVLAPGGYFDFTFNRTEGPEHHVLREDFYYRTATLVRLAADHGLAARFMDDWEDLPHRQSKIRVTHRGEREEAA